MKERKYLLVIFVCLVVATFMAYVPLQGVAQDEGDYVGAEKCAECHPDVVETWQFTVHRRTMFNDDPSKRGCESCHGPGKEHIESGGDPEAIVRPEKMKPEQTAAICLKCHTQENVTLWHTSQHARAKVSCTNCHDSHAPDTNTLTKDIESARLQVEGLSRAIKDAELAASIAAKGSEERDAANEKVYELKVERDRLLKSLNVLETVYNRSNEPYLCFTCHKAQQVQSKMPSHHPIIEGKMKCSDCHNPHGGPSGMLRGESVNETCFRCHAEKVGPFVFDHPPVSEDCTICHKPHGSVQNNLLAQSEPFLCLRCHAGPHSRRSSNTGPNALSNPVEFATYYTECTDCHSMAHGSDEHAPLHF